MWSYWWCEETLRWRHNERDRVSNHQPRKRLLKCLFRGRSKKTSKLRVTGLCAGNSRVTGEFPVQMASNAENVPIWWRHHEFFSSSKSTDFYDDVILIFQTVFLFLYNDAMFFVILLCCIHTLVIYLLRMFYVCVILWMLCQKWRNKTVKPVNPGWI